MSRPFVAVACLVHAVSGASAAAPAPAPVRLAVEIKVARCDGKPVQADRWVEEHVAAAARLLAPHGVLLQASRGSFATRRCALLDGGERDALAVHVDPGRVTVLVVQRARDLSVLSYDLMGVHWRYRGDDARLRGRHFVILTSRARPPVLAHELCHYLGLSHDQRGGNLMTPGPSSPVWRRTGPKPKPFAPLLTAEQGKKLRAAVLALRPQTARPPSLPE
jgi:hypothetical protein